MAEIWKDGFDHYGGDLNRMFDGVWTEVDSGALLSAVARTGTHSLAMSTLQVTTDRGIRRVLNGSFEELFISFGFRISALPSQFLASPLVLLGGSNEGITSIRVGLVGDLFIISDPSGAGGGTTIAQTAAPVIVANTWHHIEVRFVRSTTVGVVELRVDGVVVINQAGLNTGASAYQQYAFLARSFGATMYVDDLIIRDNTGTTNNTFMGDLRIATLFPVADAVAQGWTARRRTNLGTGILDLVSGGNDDAVSAADAADLEIAAQDFTVEGFVRFLSLPTTTQKWQIFGKWQESGNQRSWQLFKAGPDVFGGNLVFRTSTDGQAGTVVEVHSQPFAFEINRWYHIAVSRAAGTSRLFVDGAQLGTSKADAANYFNGTGTFAVGAEMSSATATIANTSVNGWMDEVRFTVGVGRYTAEFAPPAVKFPRDGTDPNFASVMVLAGFDSGINDESSVGRTLTARGGAQFITPDDGAPGAYKVIDDPAPIDDTFVEAALVAAIGTLTVTANPLDTETVTIGATTYTFNTVLGGANSVLIGVDSEASLFNLKSAINAEAGAGSLYGTSTVQNVQASAAELPDPQLRITARTPGAAGNAIATTETLSNGSFGAATLQGGADIPGPSEFVIGALPPETTGIRSLTIVNRGFKADAGSSEVVVSFVTASGAADAGAARPMTLTPTYREDIFERDPATLGILTPSTFAGAKVRLNRTL